MYRSVVIVFGASSNWLLTVPSTDVHNPSGTAPATCCCVIIPLAVAPWPYPNLLHQFRPEVVRSNLIE